MTKTVKFNAVYEFDEAIDRHNERIETYRKLAPAVMPLIIEYQSSIDYLNLDQEQLSISFSNGAPKGFLLKCEELGLDVDVSCSSMGFGLGVGSKYYYITLRGKCPK